MCFNMNFNHSFIYKYACLRPNLKTSATFEYRGIQDSQWGDVLNDQESVTNYLLLRCDEYLTYQVMTKTSRSTISNGWQGLTKKPIPIIICEANIVEHIWSSSKQKFYFINLINKWTKRDYLWTLLCLINLLGLAVLGKKYNHYGSILEFFTTWSNLTQPTLTKPSTLTHFPIPARCKTQKLPNLINQTAPLYQSSFSLNSTHLYRFDRTLLN